MKPGLLHYLCLLGLLFFLAPAWAGQTPLRIVFDTDANNEMDDQFALAYLLLNQKHFNVEGITTHGTSGGGPVALHTAEAQRLVALCGRAQSVPVKSGANGRFQDIQHGLAQEAFDGAAAVDFIIDRAMTAADQPLVVLAVGKLTNIALALAKEPGIAKHIRLVWLGSNYPAPGEYNLVHDEDALVAVLEAGVPLEIVTVRYLAPSGTDVVKVSLTAAEQQLPGQGPLVTPPVIGRHGGEFSHVGDYLLNLFQNFRGSPKQRPLFDMAAVAILKNPEWAEATSRGSPRYADSKWQPQPDNPRQIILWENFNRDAIVADLFATLSQ